MSDICTDNRFEMIEKYRELLKENTNIETSYDEMQTIDNILFRFWQMGWLDKIELANKIVRCKDCKYANKERLPQGSKWFASCDHFNTHSVMADDFCSYGERRENNE